MATGAGNLPVAIPAVSPFDTILASWGNGVRSDIIALADGSGVGDGAITPLQRSGGYMVGTIAGATLGTTGNKSITGLGFKPKLVEFMLAPTSGTGTAFIGEGSMSESGDQQWVAYAIATSGQTRNADTNGACAMLTSVSNATPALLFSYVSMNADGFTINVDTASSAFPVMYKAFA